MNAYLLMEHLAVTLAQHLCSLPLLERPARTVTEGTLRPPSVYVGDLPPKTGTDEQVPFVLIQDLQGECFSRGQNIHLALRCAVWNSDPKEGLADLHNLLSACLRFCAQFEEVPLAKRWQLVPDKEDVLLSWRRPDDQAPEHFEAYILTRWLTAGV